MFDCAGAKLASTPLGRGFEIMLQFHLYEYIYNSSRAALMNLLMNESRNESYKRTYN